AKFKRSFEETLKEDISVILTVINRRWDKAFKPYLSYTEKAIVSELIDVRNRWAHGVSFSTEDTYRALDSMSRLLNTIGAIEQEPLIDKHKQEIFKRLIQEKSQPHDSQTSREELEIRERLKELLDEIPFQDARLLQRALTHRSYVFEHPTKTEGDNEQLEFLGDSVLNFLAGDYLYDKYLGRNEGELTRRRSNLVDNSQFANFATELDLGEWIQLGRGEELQGGRTKPSLLSNTFEAVMGAYYLDSGVEAVREFIQPFFESVESGVIENNVVLHQQIVDVKGYLQNWAQTNDLPLPEYYVVDEMGNDHAKTFTIQVQVNGEFYGEGTGKKKKEAEKQAAIDALQRLGLL
ncbi:MAG: ribonuclease III, partial [Cyanobacteriota bacterium]|nr:ribonuclease III [Cyanobacteriota bacterium]